MIRPQRRWRPPRRQVWALTRRPWDQRRVQKEGVQSVPCPRGPPVLLPFRACPVETTLFPQGFEPPRGGVPRGLQPHVEVPSEEQGPGATRALGCRVHGHVSSEGRLRRPGVAAAAGPWTLMTVRVPPAVTTSRAMALPGTMSTMSRTSSAANTSARRAIKSPPRTAAADAAWASTPGYA